MRTVLSAALLMLSALPAFAARGGTDLGEEPAPLERPKHDALQVVAMVNFFTGSDKLSPRSMATLRKVVQRFVDDPSLNIELDGHTDFSGAERYNMGLSEARARAVSKFLVDHGVAAPRITVLGWGMYNPLESNRTEAGRARNRRVEIKAAP